MPAKYSDLENLALNPPGGPTPSASTTGAIGTPAQRGREKFGKLKIAQAQLKSHGFNPGHPPNGQMTAGTKAALAAFQKQNNLSPTGTLDARTQQRLSMPPRTAGRSTGSRRMSGGPVLVNRGKKKNAGSAAGRHSHAGMQGNSGAKAQSRTQPGASTSAMGIGPGGATGRKEIMKGQAEYESAGKRVPVIFSAASVASLAQAAIIVQPQIEFRGENIVCDTTTAANFSLVSLTVGVPPQVGAGTGNLPFTLFSPQQNGAIDYEMDLCNAGTQMTMTVVNNDTTAAHAFVAAIWGHEIVEVSQS